MIELSVDVLEKLGFRKSDKKFSLYGEYYLDIDSESGIEFLGDCIHVVIYDDPYYNIKCQHIKYLNQLQNLYFALTGNELNYKQ